MSVLLKVSNLRYREGFLNSYGLNFEINTGELILINGEVGSGKSTLVDLISGAKKLEHGWVQRTAPISVVTQKFTLYKDLTVEENFEFICTINGCNPLAKQKILSRTGLDGWEKKLAGELPVGLQKMLQIACGVCRGNTLLVLDEPFLGLDRRLQGKLLELLYELVQNDIGILILSVDEDPGIQAKRTYKLDQGGLTLLTENELSGSVSDKSTMKGATA